MKTLVAISSAEQADDILGVGIAFARATGSALTILHVIKDAAERAEAQVIIDRAVRLAWHALQDLEQFAAGSQIDAQVRLGHPAEEIVHEALAGDYSLIVIGTWPAHHLWHRLLAPTTERVLMQASCPVLIAKGELRSLRHILLCVSGADDRHRAAAFLTDMVNHMTADVTITVLHVMSQISAGLDGQQGWQLEAPAEALIAAATPEGQWLSQEIAILRQTHAHTQPKVRHGLVVDEVLMETLDGDCDLLVIGAHRQAGWQRFLLDDLSHQIITRADRPVLVV